MKIAFWKMHGASNDFILVDDRQLTFPAADKAWLASVGARRTGVGCEGIILIQPSAKTDFQMRFFNPDGSEVDMCGNGARCVARLAYDIGVAPARMRFETGAGMIEAEMVGDRVRLQMTAPKDWKLNATLAPAKSAAGDSGYHTGLKEPLTYGFVNSGVPHVVIEADDLEKVDVARIGAEVRYHADFAPKGTNANFIKVTGPDSLRIRTYERGVEAETLACGTGMVAAGLIAGRMGRVKPPVKITCASGDVIEVDYKLSGETAVDVTMLGPAAYVFTGELEY